MEVIAIIFFLLLYLAVCAAGLANYILSSLSMMQLADVLEVKNAWLAWIPVGNTYVLGATADQLEAKRGVSRKWGKLLLILSLVVCAVFLLMFVGLFTILAYIGISEATGDFYYEELIIAPFIVFYLVYIVVLVAAMALSYLTAVCIYKIFEELVPQKAIKYFLLYVLVPFGNVFCFFRCKKLVEDELYAQRAAAKAAQEVPSVVTDENARDDALAFGYDPAPSLKENKEENTNENDQQ